MTLFATIWSIVSNIPGIISLFVELWQFIGALKNPQTRSEHMETFIQALRAARVAGNTEPLRKLHKEWVDGIQPADTVGIG